MVLRDQGTKERINRGLKSEPMGSVLPRRNRQPIEEHDPSRTWRADTITLYVAGPNFGLPDSSPFVTKAEVKRCQIFARTCHTKRGASHPQSPRNLHLI